MKRHLFPRILWFILLNCVIFILLVTMQFTRRGNFSQKIGDMQVSGRYAPEASDQSIQQPLSGGAKVFFGGLEFQLASPEYITIMEDGAAFILSGGTELFFVSQNPGELQISGKLPENGSPVEIPLRTQRSSVIRNGSNDTPAILYSGSRYQFNRPLQILESGQLALLVTASTISYRTVSEQKEFSPAQFIIPHAETVQDFSDTLSRWINRNFALWGNMDSLPDEDTVIAWCGEAIQRSNYRSAVSVIPVGFSSSPQRTWESAVYQFDRRIGVWEKAAQAISSFESEKARRVSQLIAEKNSSIFIEKHLIEFLAIRSNSSLTDNFISFAQEVTPSFITLEMAPGILENCMDMYKWHPYANNPFEPLAEQVLQLISQDLYRADDQVFVLSDGVADTEFNLRLGTALHKWEEKSGDADWAGVGRSLLLSVIALSNDNGSVPVSLVIDKASGSNREMSSSAEQISSAKLYRLFSDNEHLPHAVATGTNMWAWTASPSVQIVQSSNENELDISVTFPTGDTHYVMIRNVPPFALLQIYDINWRRAIDFESYYDSAGWYYFEQERTLVIKIRHRSNVENIKLYFTAPRPPQTETPTEQQAAAEQQEQGNQ